MACFRMAFTPNFRFSLHSSSLQRQQRSHINSSTIGVQSRNLFWKGCKIYVNQTWISSFGFHFLGEYLATCSWRQQSSIVFSAGVPVYSYLENEGCYEHWVDKSDGLNGIDSLVKILHESAEAFALGIRKSASGANRTELAKAWIGVDVHAWYKHISYQASIYSLFQVAIGIDELGEDLAPIHRILSPITHMLEESINNQLNARNPKLGIWFKNEQLPILAGYFKPLFKKWSTKYTPSGVAVTMLALSSAVAVGRLGSGRISCPMLLSSLPDVIEQLMELLSSLVSMDRMYSVANEGGLEHVFLAHFGPKGLNHNPRSEKVFWMGLVQKKLSIAFKRESVVTCLQKTCKTKVQEADLSTLGLFAILGRRTRLFLSNMGIKDLDEPLKDFLSYLECGSIFIYPELSSISTYQLFMEVVSEELGWLDFYGAFHSSTVKHQERRGRLSIIQAKKEIILSTVFNVCLDWFSNFSHFSKSTHQTLNVKLIDFLLRSQHLLNICLEDYWAAYDQSCETMKSSQASALELVAPSMNQTSRNPSISFEERMNQRTAEILVTGINGYLLDHMTQQRKVAGREISDYDRSGAVDLGNLPCTEQMEPIQNYFLSKLREHADVCKLCKDIWMGTRLLFIDMSVAVGLLQKQTFGHKLTQRERKALKRLLIDMASTVPVAILMLLPVTAIGHAAILAAIKKYIPFLIPSPYSSQRLDAFKQLERTKKMDVKSWNKLDFPSSL